MAHNGKELPLVAKDIRNVHGACTHMGLILQFPEIKEEISAKQGMSLRKDIPLHSFKKRVSTSYVTLCLIGSIL